VCQYRPLTHIGGAPVTFATRKDIAISSQFLSGIGGNLNEYYIGYHFNIVMHN
jgi:hypothetical protein